MQLRLLFILFAVPLLGYYFNFDTSSAIIFILVVGYLIVKYKKVLDFQSMVKLSNIPLVYAVLWRTKFGLSFMDKFAKKHRELVKLLGYSFIGFGFFGMIFISGVIIRMLFGLFTAPLATSQEVSLVLPLTNIPGIGYLSFWHFLITLFITVLIHEFAHGIVARAHNVPIKSSGIGAFGILLPLFPLAFVEPDEKKMNKSSDIVQYSILSAGPMINIIFAALVALLTLFAINPIYAQITHPVGFSFQNVMENFPAQEAGLLPGMVITSVNGVDVIEYQDFSNEVGILKPGQELALGTPNGTFTLTTKESPDDPERGYIGILGVTNERRINEGKETLGGIFFWVQGLFKWLYFINVAIGLMNLLPLMITDGGRMLKIALDKLYTNKKKAEKIWLYIGGIFIFTLLLALLIRYGSGLFTLLS